MFAVTSRPRPNSKVENREMCVCMCVDRKREKERERDHITTLIQLSLSRELSLPSRRASPIIAWPNDHFRKLCTVRRPSNSGISAHGFKRSPQFSRISLPSVKVPPEITLDTIAPFHQSPMETAIQEVALASQYPLDYTVFEQSS